MKMKRYKYKGIINRAIGCLVVFVVMGVFNMSFAQNKEIKSNEKQVVECTPVNTKRDIAFERHQKAEKQTAETRAQSNKKEDSEGDNNQNTPVVIKQEELKADDTKMNREELKAAEAVDKKVNVAKKTEVINEK